MKTINKFLVIVMVFLTIGITVIACSSSKKTLTENNIPVVAGVEEEFKLENQEPNYGEKPVIDAI